MNCELCGKDGAHFMGVSSSYGPTESDAENTSENLPGGFGWLCDECVDLITELPDGGSAVKCRLEGEWIYWQGTGFYTLVHNMAFWGYVKMDDEWMKNEPETEYRIVEKKDLVVFPKGIPVDLPDEIHIGILDEILEKIGLTRKEYEASMEARGYEVNKVNLICCLEDDLGCKGGSWKKAMKASGNYEPIYKK